MNRKKSFEEQWQAAFRHQEITPSPKVWENIAQKLPPTPISFLEKYSLEIAASIAILFVIGWYYLLNLPTKKEEGEKIDENAVLITRTLEEVCDATPTHLVIAEETSSTQHANQGKTSTSTMKTTHKSSEKPLVSNTKPMPSNTSTTNTPTNTIAAQPLDGSENNYFLANKLSSQKLSEGTLQQLPSAHVVADFYPTAQHLAPIPPKKTASTVTFFGEIMAGRIAFNPNVSSKRDYEQMLHTLENRQVISGSFNSGENIVAFLRSAKKTQEMTPKLQESYTWGASVGATFYDRLRVQTGLIRKHFVVSSYSYAILWNVERIDITQLDFSTLDHLYRHDYRMESVLPYKIYHEYDFLSVPVQVSYKLLDRKIDFSVSTGISTEFFLENKIYTHRVAANSTRHQRKDNRHMFRNQHVQGILSCEISYEIAKNYSLSFSPVYQKSLTNFAKTSANFTSYPSQLGVNLGIRYYVE